MSIADLPTINAVLNTLAAICLVMGYRNIKRDNRDGHRTWMLRALGFSALFLVTYVIYHHYAGSVPYPYHNWTRPLYFAILIPHIILAAVMTPLIAAAVWFALRGNFDRHKRIVKFTYPVWLFVSVSGVAIYVMLYVV
jgi:putative membrane protein